MKLQTESGEHPNGRLKGAEAGIRDIGFTSVFLIG